MLDTFEPDECCLEPIVKASIGGLLDNVLDWACPKCGQQWCAHDLGEVRHWHPHEHIEVLR